MRDGGGKEMDDGEGGGEDGVRWMERMEWNGDGGWWVG
jgi:hypothetical protein